MWIPEWVLWIVFGCPCLYVALGVLSLAVGLGKDAEQNAEKRTREALEVLSCPDCRPLLPAAKCETHRWHTTPPPESLPRT